VKLGTKIAVKSVEMEGSYKFISKDRIKTKFNFMGKTKEDEQLVSIEGDTLTLTTIDPDTGKEDPTDVDKFKRAE
jgi:hypothetical protein